MPKDGMNQETKICQNCKSSFAIEPYDFAFYERIKVPAPTWCPECRLIRRMMVRNERALYRRKCDLCGKESIGMYSPEKPFSVYCRSCWFGDGWDPMTYGRDYDFSKPFLVQFQELMKAVPRVSLVHYNANTNVDYANFVADSKNVYLGYSIVECENIRYSYSQDKSKDCSDCLFLKNAELCYENVDGSKNYTCRYLFRSRDCVGSAFLFDCTNCQNCFMSSNLRNKQFVFRNNQLDKESYERALESVDLGSWLAVSTLRDEFAELCRSSLHKFANVVKAVNSFGENLNNVKNVTYSFNIYDSENTKYAARGFNLKDSSDVYGALGELMYEGTVTGWNSSNVSFFDFASGTRDSQYTDWCHDSSNLFSCAGLRNKQYCIFNKQYSKEEYEKLMPRIRKHMDDMPYVDAKGRVYQYGEFFPPELSPFAYNETLAQEYFPLTKEQALDKGYQWRDSDTKQYQVTRRPGDLPDHIKDVTDSIFKETIGCEHGGRCNHQCTTAFKVVPEELKFYQRMNLPLPRLCPNCRHYERLAQRNPLKLWHRKCMCEKPGHFHEGVCPNEFETSYAPDRPETVYCEQCYNAEVV